MQVPEGHVGFGGGQGRKGAFLRPEGGRRGGATSTEERVSSEEPKMGKLLCVCVCVCVSDAPRNFRVCVCVCVCVVPQEVIPDCDC